MNLECLNFMKLNFIALFDPPCFPCTYTEECFVSAFGKDVNSNFLNYWGVFFASFLIHH